MKYKLSDRFTYERQVQGAERSPPKARKYSMKARRAKLTITRLDEARAKHKKNAGKDKSAKTH